MDKNDDILEILKELKDDSPYKVPEGYFDSLPERIRGHIRQNSLSQKTRIIQILKPWMGLAAGFLFIITLYFTLFPEKTNIKTATNSSYLYEIYDDVIDPIVSQFNEYDLAYHLSEKDINDLNSDSLLQTDLYDITIEDIEDLILF